MKFPLIAICCFTALVCFRNNSQAAVLSDSIRIENQSTRSTTHEIHFKKPGFFQRLFLLHTLNRTIHRVIKDDSGGKVSSRAVWSLVLVLLGILCPLLYIVLIQSIVASFLYYVIVGLLVGGVVLASKERHNAPNKRSKKVADIAYYTGIIFFLLIALIALIGIGILFYLFFHWILS